jgi:ArsR family transcriptional regulator
LSAETFPVRGRVGRSAGGRLPLEGVSEPHAISALSALAQPTRLAIFRLLIKHEPVRITGGVIADTIGAPHKTLSTHLAILVRAGLLRSVREGRTIIYRSNVDTRTTVQTFVQDFPAQRRGVLAREGHSET